MTLCVERWLGLPPVRCLFPDGGSDDGTREEPGAKDREDVYVSGNVAIYFSELQAKKNDFRGPDVFVVLP
ncbi:hypothetical protein WMF20_25545 [Sorangium sp. So ce834]|uniref:hypothetical protein n=1 Tax=Sorangium sp. So ce834 TaxID=3133321 RepID=UPI003F6372C4